MGSDSADVGDGKGPTELEKKEPQQLPPEFGPTPTAKSQLRLASSLGYPAGWRVVRTRITPIDGASASVLSFQDRIYAGDPELNIDAYFNHVAAMDAALRWVEGESTGYEHKGGQMSERTASHKEGDEVEVYYEPDETWYEATIEKVTVYEDDIRYTVHYTEEDATQSNVSEEHIRKTASTSGKKKKRTLPESEEEESEESSEEESSEEDEDESSEDGDDSSESSSSSEEEERRKETTIKKKLTKSKKVASKPAAMDNPEALALATKMGFPKGWSARERPGSRYTIWDPTGTERFESKKAAFGFLGMEAPLKKPPMTGGGSGKGKKRKGAAETGKADSKKRKSDSEKKSERRQQKAPPPVGNPDDDPPWRMSGHDYLGRRVEYSTAVPDGDGETLVQRGTVLGWISATDFDSQGEPGFLSEKTGEPAALFHVVFDENPEAVEKVGSLALQSQDLEEYELLDCLVRGGEDGDGKAEEEATAEEANTMEQATVEVENDIEFDEEDEDDVPLTALVQKKFKRVTIKK